MIPIVIHKYFGYLLYEITFKKLFELNIFVLIINMQYHFLQYVKQINKLRFEKQWEYVQKKLVSKHNVDIKFKEFLLILEGYFASYERLCRDKNIAIGNQLLYIFSFCSKYIDDYFICNRLRCIDITCERISDKIYNIFIPIKHGNYIKSELYF